MDFITGIITVNNFCFPEDGGANGFSSAEVTAELYRLNDQKYFWREALRRLLEKHPNDVYRSLFVRHRFEVEIRDILKMDTGNWYDNFWGLQYNKFLLPYLVGQPRNALSTFFEFWRGGHFKEGEIESLIKEDEFKNVFNGGYAQLMVGDALSAQTRLIGFGGRPDDDIKRFAELITFLRDNGIKFNFFHFFYVYSNVMTNEDVYRGYAADIAVLLEKSKEKA